METQPADVFRELQVERVEREDGRYVLYFSWPDIDADQPDPAAEPEHPDV